MLNFSTMTKSSKIRLSPGLTAFGYMGNKRGAQIIDFLTKNKLSVFSPEFQLRHNWLPTNVSCP